MKRPILAAVTIALAAAPATASGATVRIETANGSPTAVYTASPGEVNALRLAANPGQPRLEFFEFSANLIAGPGCLAGFPVVCEPAFVPVRISLGDRGDVANANSFTGTMSMDAGSGDDDVLAGGFEASAVGGSGNDTIRLAADGAVTGSGGSGRDKVSGGLGASFVTLAGDSGNDLLVPDGSQSNVANGGTDHDRLVSFQGRQVTLSGDAGFDVLVAADGDGQIVLDGGSGADVLFSHLGNVTVNGGSSTDAIDVRGGTLTVPDTVSCGSGLDVVFADATDTVDADCELRLNRDAPALPGVARAEADARDLLAHRPDPSAR